MREKCNAIVLYQVLNEDPNNKIEIGRWLVFADLPEGYHYGVDLELEAVE